MSQYPNKNLMADELFRLVERDAGYAHISDGIDILSEEELLDLAEKCRGRHEACVKLLNDFLYHHSTRIVLKRPYAPMKKQP